MRYLCTNPDCSKYGQLVVGWRPTCPACEQRTLDEKVMIKRGMTLGSIAAAKGRRVQAPAPPPPEAPVQQPPAPEEESDVTRHRMPRRTWDELKAAIPAELLAKQLASKAKLDVAKENGIALKTLHRLMQEYNLVSPQRGKAQQTAEEGTPVAEIMPDSLAPAAAIAGGSPQSDKTLDIRGAIEGEKTAQNERAAVDKVSDIEEDERIPGPEAGLRKPGQLTGRGAGEAPVDEGVGARNPGYQPLPGPAPKKPGAAKAAPPAASEGGAAKMRALAGSMDKASAATQRFALAAGLGIHVERVNQPAHILLRDLTAMRVALETSESRFNLTVLLEEVP